MSAKPGLNGVLRGPFVWGLVALALGSLALGCGPESEVELAKLPDPSSGGAVWGAGNPGNDGAAPPFEAAPSSGEGGEEGRAPSNEGPLDKPLIPGESPGPAETPPEDAPPDDPPQEDPPVGDPPPENPPPENPPPENPPPENPPPENPPPENPPVEEPPQNPPPVDPNGCYQELYYPDTPIGDLKSSYNSGKWLSTSLEVLKRRYPAGHWLLYDMQNDPYLPGFVWGSSFGELMDSLGTMCHEETHGWDYDTALGMYPKHAYYNTPELMWYPTKHPSFPRSEIQKYLPNDGSTSLYDSTYLGGSMGTYELYDHGDEINAYINGLACNVAVGEQIPYGVSAMDGAAGALLYLLTYLKAARLDHPGVYSTLQQDPEWHGFFRYVWARGHFWINQSAVFPQLDIKGSQIMGHVNNQNFYQEIELFTGHTADYVACHPEAQSATL